ncbi:DUF4397 domain-containing protein [Streptomyces sp. WAC 00631]|uniref:DUF4397 domain-containing protein n=1 Tax=unclassified Streptomyces TaxID=2593676 RepID=UPI000F7A2EDE|nr:MULTISPECIES: DUF4397 domain-containing protein [unclassified Streptomyces]MCC5032495.1 DUF4397 domain-containing protein [Streptomyces sp. WAC 00631]MCC9740598.1 DUF4397 domain-containing protein [Streptomyces sp. MNU89]
MRNCRSAAAIAATVGICALGLSAAPAQAGPAQTGEGKAQVSVFHGVPGLTVDVYANGKELLPNFKPGTLTPPQALDPGSYDIEVFEAGADPEGEPAIQKTVEVPAGANATVAAHLTADGKPTLNAYVNDVSKVPAGKARLTVRHVAAAPAVDVRADGTPIVKGLENPKEATTTVPAGTVNADVTLAGTDDVVIGPAQLALKEGTSNVVYAWGSAEEKNLALKTQTFSGLHSAPGGVKGGQSDSLMQAGADSSDGASAWAAWSGAGAVAAAGVLLTRTAWRGSRSKG